tara:strand:- start:398 stop:634 length:237 start_codon:yes stop_codon:yes gene_type:complete
MVYFEFIHLPVYIHQATPAAASRNAGFFTGTAADGSFDPTAYLKKNQSEHDARTQSQMNTYLKWLNVQLKRAKSKPIR